MSDNTVLPFPATTLTPAPALTTETIVFANSLRDIAQRIESGEYGDVKEGALVTSGRSLEIFAIGTEEGVVAHYLMCCGANKVQLALLDQGEQG